MCYKLQSASEITIQKFQKKLHVISLILQISVILKNKNVGKYNVVLLKITINICVIFDCFYYRPRKLVCLDKNQTLQNTTQ